MTVPELIPDPDGPVRYPDVEVELLGHDGNAFAIIGRVQGAMRRAGVRKGEIDAYVELALRGTYDELLQTTMRWVETS